VTKQDIFTKGPIGGLLNGTPGTPCHHSTSHPEASSHKDTPPQGLSLSHVPAIGISHGERPGSIPLGKTCPRDSSSYPARSTRPSPLTQDSCQDLLMFIIMLLSGYRHLVPYLVTPLTHQHHITDIMRVRVKAIVTSNIAASNLVAG
jgi:hypothetical protein